MRIVQFTRSAARKLPSGFPQGITRLENIVGRREQSGFRLFPRFETIVNPLGDYSCLLIEKFSLERLKIPRGFGSQARIRSQSHQEIALLGSHWHVLMKMPEGMLAQAQKLPFILCHFGKLREKMVGERPQCWKALDRVLFPNYILKRPPQKSISEGDVPRG